MLQRSQKSKSSAGAAALDQGVQMRKRSANTDPNKQPGYAEQAAALQPDVQMKGKGKAKPKPKAEAKQGKVVDIDLKFKKVRLHGKSSYAEIEFTFRHGPDREVSTETLKIKFVRGGDDDWDLAEIITDAVLAAPQLAAKDISMEAALDWDALYQPSLMALRDEAITPNTPY